MYDIAIIGAGVIGCSIARELSKYKLDVCVIEKDNDVANGTSKANSGIIHPGEDPVPGTLKAKLNIRGNQMFDELQKELDFPFKRNGSMLLCFKEEELPKLEEFRQRGLQNGIPDTMQILSREEAIELESCLSEQVVGALLLPTGGVVCPYELTIALAENAYINGVSFLLETEVLNIRKIEEAFYITTDKDPIEAKIVINAAGVYADDINNRISEVKYHITARKGEYLLFDKEVGGTVKHTLFQLPTDMGKGVLVTPTVSGNLLVGPTASDIENKWDVDTTEQYLDEAVDKAKLSVERIPMNKVITSFSGLRAHEVGGDFIIGESKDVKGFINVLGIESPGLTSAPAIGEYIRELVICKTKAPLKLNFNPIRKNIVKFAQANEVEKKELIKKDKHYGRIVCRCEQVTEAEIIAAMHAPLGAKTVDSIKRRTRAGMGRCQSGFCINRIVEILSMELNIREEEVTKFGGESNILMGCIKAGLGADGRGDK